jgi:AmpD protein
MIFPWVELEGTDDQPFTDAQYAALIDLTRQLLAAYPASPRSAFVVTAILPRAQDRPRPAFDWTRFRSALQDGGHAR